MADKSDALLEKLSRSVENNDRINLITECFGASGQPLLVPGRVLIGEGILHKVCRKKVKPRIFFLFNDIVVYGNIVFEKKKYNKQHVIPLENVTIRDLPDNQQAILGGDSTWNYGWQLCTPKKSFTLYAATADEKREWMKHIGNMKERQLRKQGSQETPSVPNNIGSTQPAAVWVPDDHAPTCMVCKKRKFTPVVRRHHCRKCGIVCCSDCSDKRFLLPQISKKPVRVCITCYNSLSQERFRQEIQAQKDADGLGDTSEDSSDEDDDADDSNTNSNMSTRFHDN